MDSTSKLENYLEALKYKNIPFIVLSSGFSGKDVIERWKKYSFIKEVIIFCGNKALSKSISRICKKNIY